MALSRSTPKPNPSFRFYWHAVRLAIALGSVAILIRCLGVRRAVALVWNLADLFPSHTPAAPDPLRMARASAERVSAVAGRMPFPPRCLTSSLLLSGALRRHGVPGELCIGVSDAGKFSAHAWVELGSVVLNDTADVTSRFHPIWRAETSSTGLWPR